MNCMEDLMKELVEELSKDIPADVLCKLKELSKLQADVSTCMVRNIVIDTHKINRINELTRKHFYHEETKDAPKAASEPDTFDFGEAIRRVKGGARVARNGWNGKDQHIELATEISYLTKWRGVDADGFARHKDIGSKAIAFVGTRGTQIGWLASQADMLADDWYEVKKED